MTEWEYMVESGYYSSQESVAMAEYLNRLGAVGWELVLANTKYLVLKRPVEPLHESIRREREATEREGLKPKKYISTSSWRDPEETEREGLKPKKYINTSTWRDPEED